MNSISIVKEYLSDLQGNFNLTEWGLKNLTGYTSQGKNSKLDVATFGAGCFWGVEAEFSQFIGVLGTKVGFMGGKVKNPSYKEVCNNNTGHAEVVHLIYDPTEISYDTLLDTFWKIHNPTTLNRQGPDYGSQYRSVIFYHSEEQKESALESKKKLEESKKFKSPIVTQITAAGEFYAAEEYHQKYLEKNGRLFCHRP